VVVKGRHALRYGSVDIGYERQLQRDANGVSRSTSASGGIASQTLR
jgi:hypothetical protein